VPRVYPTHHPTCPSKFTHDAELLVDERFLMLDLPKNAGRFCGSSSFRGASEMSEPGMTDIVLRYP
jgi:hypothetical protein